MLGRCKEAPSLAAGSAYYERIRSQTRMHDRWEAQYHRRHPETAEKRGGMQVWTGLRAARLRWHWRGRPQSGWQWAFYDYWGVLPRTNLSLRERLHRAGISHAQFVAKILAVDEVGLLPRSKAFTK